MPPATSSTIPAHTDSTHPPSSFVPSGQFRYSFSLKDETTPKRLLDQVLATTVPVLVWELIAVAPDVHRQLKDLSTAKQIPVSTNTVQVNELARRDPGTGERAFGSHVHQNDNSTIVTHHSVLLWSLEAKIISTSQSILGVLDSGSEIVAMPR